jgi:hypothetical protein
MPMGAAHALFSSHDTMPIAARRAAARATASRFERLNVLEVKGIPFGN